ncbi:single-stranded DNA-binding protein [Tissierella praeacuta]|uniref:Single-stranded DNA-binding protein n=1 Tax=Tissierella praeacuta DSM 18095 TaxID=1123404 RepID=A0A1M4WT47_9FIRM|nr:single-stranded DNA-binding protein [Tissierella praeacuta]MBU5256568.1 single-stranded DNA-binding protein [Tissierella praeacuta]TCU75820.1 single-stranded DNA-binding protein [Tissierella praeacuta]SHE84416.1 Single-stranded DNA-binding protein [Tissierella praeacuta DSM 18095]SUP00494.1 Single-stranded DNA-binding protein ssbB [Tissierella praeacuta]
MLDKIMDTNSVRLVGKVVSEKVFSHEMYGEGFYNIDLEVPRLSDSVDLLPVTVSERLMVDVDLSIGEYIIVEGQLRSYNRYIDNGNRLVLTIFAKDIYMPMEDELAEALRKPNEIYLDGYICKKPIYRTTPFGREITDILIAVNRSYNKSDYIPCISWGRNARFCEKMLVGDHIKLWGRIQSREYHKKLANGELEKKIAFEVSISKLEYVENDNNRLAVCEEEI